MSDRRRRIAGESRPGQARPSRRVVRPQSPRRSAQPEPSRQSVRLGTKRERPASTQPAAVTSPPPITPLVITGVVICALIAITGIGFGVWKSGMVAGSDDTPDTHQAAAKQAGEDMVTVFSYEYDSLDEHLAEAKELMTDSFADDFNEVAPALQQLAPENKVRVDAQTRAYAPIECGDSCSSDKASVLVFVDQARTKGESDPKVFGNRVKVDMVKQGGDWLINDIRAL